MQNTEFRDLFNSLPTEGVLPAMRKACRASQNILTTDIEGTKFKGMDRVTKGVFDFSGITDQVHAAVLLRANLDPTSVAGELTRPNSVLFWVEYLNTLPADLIAKMGNTFRDGTDLADDLSTPLEIGAHLSFSNSFLFELSLQGQGLAALLGRNFAKCITDSGKDKTFYNSALEVAKRFRQPVRTGTTFYNRMRALYPSDEPIYAPGTALYNLVKGEAFTSIRRRHCPAGNITTASFQAYGQVLAEPGYKELFLERTKVPFHYD